MLRHPLTHVRAGRYRTRTAAEATAACGGNREPRLGQRSDFSKPCQGAAEKSANATRTGTSRQIPSRFPTPRNVYQERCRQTIRSGDFFRGGRYRTRTARHRRRRGSSPVLRWKIIKTRNLFGAKMAQKGFRVSDFALFLCASCYRIFILQQPLFFISGDFIFGYRLPCRARRGRNIPSG